MPSDGPLAPPNVPNAWTVRPLRLVTTLIKDGTHGTHKRVESGIPFLSAKNITNEGTVMFDESDSQVAQEDFDTIHKSYRMKSGDILLTVVGSLGRHALLRADPEFTIQRSVAVIRPSGVMYPAYLDHYFSGTHFQGQLDGRSNSTAQAGVYLGELAKIPVTVPPLPEQKKIAAILSSVDEAIQATQAVIEQTRRVKEGLLQDLLTRGIGHTRFKQTEIGEIPESWEVRKVSEVARVVAGGTPSRSADGLYGGSIPWVKSGEVNDYRIRTTEETITEVALSESAAKLIPKGSTLIAMYGATAGVVGFLEVDAATNQAIAALIPKKRVGAAYLFFAAQAGTNRLMRQVQGSGQPNLNGKMIKNLWLPVPPPAEQERIAAIFESIDIDVERATATSDALAGVKAGLLQDLLTGKVRVSV